MVSWRGLVILQLAACVFVAAVTATAFEPGQEPGEDSLQPGLEPGEDSLQDDAYDLSILEKRAAPLRFGKRLLAEGPEVKTVLRRLQMSPMRFGKRYFWDSEFFTKKSPMRFGKRAPLRFGKRSSNGDELETVEAEGDLTKRAAPMRFGKRADEVGNPAAEEDLEKRAPMRFGKRAPLRFGKRAPLRFGKRAPLRFGKRAPHFELEDLHQAGAA
jgi:hypothetical protein